MKRASNKKNASRSGLRGPNGLDSHKWATKMELRRLLSGKPELKIKQDAKASR